MGETIKRLWAFLRGFFGVEPATPIAPAPVHTVVGQEFLGEFQSHYQDFQTNFVEQIRDKPDAELWGKATIEDVAVFAGGWAQTKYQKVPMAARLRWWSLDQAGIPNYAYGKLALFWKTKDHSQ